MKCIDRNGNTIRQNDTQNKILHALYKTPAGRKLLSVLVKPGISSFMGDLLDTHLSQYIVPYFIKKNHIDMSEYIETSFSSFNDFFTRKIKSSKRPIDMTPGSLIAPCDSKLTVYPINEDSSFLIKDTRYSIESLLRSEKLAKRYMGGTLLMFRLTVDDYHRYCFPDNGIKSGYKRIPGVFHTVNPVANEVFPIYSENTREYCVIKSENFGRILMMEVGALLVGRIVNYSGKLEVKRAEEKGRFEFGGSTIILCLEKGKALIDDDILFNSKEANETVVKMGEKIGTTIFQ